MRSMGLEREDEMQNPYNRYQNNQSTSTKKVKTGSKRPQVQKKKASARGAKPKSSKDSVFSMIWVVGSLAGLGISYYAFAYTDDLLDMVSHIQVGVSRSLAADEENSASQSGKKDQESLKLPAGSISEPKTDADHLTMENTNVYKALKEKRRELEKKERRLAQLEEELHKQKEEIEKQLKDMQEMRRNISSKLDKKVAADQESVEKLVGVYSSMKPKNAAVILSQIDEELAVKVLGQMKKQSAAAILNHVAPKKAQYLSEKFTGLKK